MPRSDRYKKFVWPFIVLVFVVTSLSTIMLWRLQNHIQLIAITDDSMQPALSRGDVALIRVGLPTELQNGDIISFQDLKHPGAVTSRRVVIAETSQRSLKVAADSQPSQTTGIALDSIIGSVRFKIRHAGFIVKLLYTPASLIIGIYIPAVWLLWIELRRLAYSYA